MLALRKTAAAFGAELVTLGTPSSVGECDVLVDVAAAGICGSDIHAYEWTTGYEFMTAAMPVTIGHEFTGLVREAGSGVTAFKRGDRVVCWPTITCGKCDACETGRPQFCQGRRTIGLHIDGGFADSVVVPAANCYRVPDNLSLDIAALTEPLSISVNAIDVAQAGSGDRVVVLGPGPIGLGAAWVAQHRGADVLLAGFNDDIRLAYAREMEIAHCVDLAHETLEDAVRRVFGRQADHVIEATGVVRSVTDGLAVLRSGGIMTVAGIHSGNLTLELTRFVREKKQLRGAHDTTSQALAESIRLLAENADVLCRLVTHRRPLSGALEAFELARSRQAMKVLLIPQSNGNLQ